MHEKVHNILTLERYVSQTKEVLNNKTYFDQRLQTLVTKEEQQLLVNVIEAILDVKIKTISKDIEAKLS